MYVVGVEASGEIREKRSGPVYCCQGPTVEIQTPIRHEPQLYKVLTPLLIQNFKAIDLWVFVHSPYMVLNFFIFT